MSARSCLSRLMVTSCLLLPVALGCGPKKVDSVDLSQIPSSASFDRAQSLLAQRELRQALNALKRVQFSADTQGEMEPLTRLAVADATFYQGSALAWIDARNLYLDFVTLNADHSLAPYAQLQVGNCSLKQVEQPSRDQALTRQAISDLREVRRRWADSQYVALADMMLREARANLAEAEYLVGHFYLRRKEYVAAIGRLKALPVAFPEYPELDKVMYELAQAYRRNGDQGEAVAQLRLLLNEFPEGGWADSATSLLADLEKKAAVGGPEDSP
jgi:outer membrane protein assembly factor BamD